MFISNYCIKVKHFLECYGRTTDDSFTSNLVIGSRDAVMYPRIKKVFIRTTQDQVEIRRWYEESQENGAEIAYKLRREADLSSKMATRGIETSYNGKFASNGGILGDDYNWAKSVAANSDITILSILAAR